MIARQCVQHSAGRVKRGDPVSYNHSVFNSYKKKGCAGEVMVWPEENAQSKY